MMLKNILKITFLAVAFLATHSFYGQRVQYNHTQKSGIKKIAVVDVSSIQDDYVAWVQKKEAPYVSGNKYKNYLTKIKERINTNFPKTNAPVSQPRTTVNPPEFVDGYVLSGVTAGIPVDNHLAMADKYIVNVGNSYISINNATGGEFKQLSLGAYANAAGVNAHPFDPRMIYDPVKDRFIMTFLAGFGSSDTHILVCFSQTNDPRGKWNIYRIEGNPNNKDEWTDYPMVSITNNDYYLTINLLRDNFSWQEGFVETIIWKVGLDEAYAGEDLVMDKWDGITFDGINIRNLCPAESATETLFDDMVFVSNKNFAIESDTFFMVKLDPSKGNSSDAIDIKMIKASTSYGAPPNASQKVGSLQTNDARVLEAFRLEDEIQFVGNTRNLSNNKAGIYHGIIEDINAPDEVVLNHIIGPDYEIGYPGITYTGDGLAERDAIISFSHSSDQKFAGTSALYSVPGEGYSKIIEISEGENYIDIISGVQRWGDYSGSQRNYSNPLEIWVSGFYGLQNRRNTAYVAKLLRPEIPTGAIEPQKNISKIYPIPAEDRLYIDFYAPRNEAISINLLDNVGKRIDQLYSSSFIEAGENTLSFNTSNIPQGMYIVQIIIGNQIIESKSVIIN